MAEQPTPDLKLAVHLLHRAEGIPSSLLHSATKYKTLPVPFSPSFNEY